MTCLLLKKRCVTYCIVKIVKLLSFSYPLLIRNVGLSLYLQEMQKRHRFYQYLFSFQFQDSRSILQICHSVFRGMCNCNRSVSIYFHFNFKTTAVFLKFANGRHRNATEYQYFFSFQCQAKVYCSILHLCHKFRQCFRWLYMGEGGGIPMLVIEYFLNKAKKSAKQLRSNITNALGCFQCFRLLLSFIAIQQKLNG